MLLPSGVACAATTVSVVTGKMGPVSPGSFILAAMTTALSVLLLVSVLLLFKKAKNTPDTEFISDEKWIYYGDRAPVFLPASLLLIFASLYQIYEKTIRESILYGFNFVLAYSVLMGVVLLWVMIIGSRKKQQKKAS